MKINYITTLGVALSISIYLTHPSLAEDIQPQPEIDGGSWAGAGVSNAIYIPAKGVGCAFSGVLWFAGMTLTGGTKYNMLGIFVHEACTGKWVIKGEDMAKKKDWFLED